MVCVKFLVNTFLKILLITALCAAQPSSKDVDITSLNEHVKKMDAVLQEVQSHSQAQEQKYSAVLSSVLSRLTQTTEELSTSKNITEELQLEVQKMKEINNNTLLDYMAAMDELAELKQSHNKTLMEFAELKQSHNNTLMQLKELTRLHNKSSLDYTATKDERKELKQSVNQSLIKLEMVKREVESLQTWIHKDVGFEASLGKQKNVSVGRIVFDMVSHNQEKGYNRTTGMFTAPVSGTYLFWTTIVYTSNSSPTSFSIRTSDKMFGYAYGMAEETYGVASGTSTVYLKKGEGAWIASRNDLELIAYYSHVGAVLIRQY